MSRREKVTFTVAVIIAYIAAFGSTFYLDYTEREDMKTIITTIEVTDAEYDALELELAEYQKTNLLKHWNVSNLAGVYASAGVSYHLKRYLEQNVDEQERYYVPAPEKQAEHASPLVVCDNDNISSVTAQPASAEGIPDIYLRCIQAEAGNQCYEGKLAVAEVIRNRLNSDAWPSTLEAVITQPGQFGVVANGAINSVTPDEETIAAAAAALAGSATIPTDYVYFNTSPNGSDPIQIQDHYFCR